MCAAALRSSRSISLSRVRGARKTAIPDYIEPCDPTLREHAPTGYGWVYEIKGDGYRAQLHIRADEVRVYSRTGLDWTKQFSSIAAAAPALKARLRSSTVKPWSTAPTACRTFSNCDASSAPGRASGFGIMP